MKIVRLQRFGNKGQYSEGSENRILEESYFEVAENVFTEFQSRDLVLSLWTRNWIVPDGEAPQYKNAVGPDAVLTLITESDNIPGASVIDRNIEFTGADYGYKDDFSEDLPVPQ